MNEAETRAELLHPKLKACVWGVVEGSKILREYKITTGVVEAKSNDLEVGEGVAQTKQYAEQLQLETTYINICTENPCLRRAIVCHFKNDRK